MTINFHFLIQSNPTSNLFYSGEHNVQYSKAIGKADTTNAILCQVVSTSTDDNNSTTTMSLEKHLFHTLHNNKIRSPTIKEFNECYEFCKVAKTFYVTNKKKNSLDNQQQQQHSNHTKLKIVIDVAGGHGALAALLLITIPSLEQAIVVDPAIITNGKNGIQTAWGHLFDITKLQYQHECLRTALPRILQSSLVDTGTGICSTNNINDDIMANEITSRQGNLSTKLYPDEILVVACHACQHLSDETIEICSLYNVHVAVLPCCQKDVSNGNQWKYFCTNISASSSSRDSKRQQHQQKLSIATTMDILLAGKAMSWSTPYTDVRIKIINEKITPQNRLILCRSSYSSSNNTIPIVSSTSNTTLLRTDNPKIIKQHQRLQLAYIKAHLLLHPSESIATKVAKRNTTEAVYTDNLVNVRAVDCRQKSSSSEQNINTYWMLYSNNNFVLYIHVPVLLFVGFLVGIGTAMFMQSSSVYTNIIQHSGQTIFGVLLGIIISTIGTVVLTKRNIKF
jgi:hypothetical protein